MLGYRDIQRLLNNRQRLQLSQESVNALRHMLDYAPAVDAQQWDANTDLSTNNVGLQSAFDGQGSLQQGTWGYTEQAGSFVSQAPVLSQYSMDGSIAGAGSTFEHRVRSRQQLMSENTRAGYLQRMSAVSGGRNKWGAEERGLNYFRDVLRDIAIDRGLSINAAARVKDEIEIAMNRMRMGP